MVTSRTGTASHKRFRIAVLQAGQNNGVTHCPIPGCGIWLDYDRGLRPNSAEPDHIVRVADGGTNSPTNGRVICRRCNQSLGSRKAATAAPASSARPLIDW